MYRVANQVTYGAVQLLDTAIKQSACSISTSTIFVDFRAVAYR